MLVIIGRAAAQNKINPIVWALIFAAVSAGAYVLEHYDLVQRGYIPTSKILIVTIAPSIVIATWIWILNKIEGVPWFLCMVSGGTIAMITSVFLAT